MPINLFAGAYISPHVVLVMSIAFLVFGLIISLGMLLYQFAITDDAEIIQGEPEETVILDEDVITED